MPSQTPLHLSQKGMASEKPADSRCTRYQIPKRGHSAYKHGSCQQACQPLPTETHRNMDIPHNQEHIQHAKQWSQQTHIPRHCIVHFVYTDNRQHASNPPQLLSRHTPPRPNPHTRKNKARTAQQTPSDKVCYAQSRRRLVATSHGRPNTMSKAKSSTMKDTQAHHLPHVTKTVT